MLKIFSWIVAIGALLYAAFGGVSLLKRPAYEVSYEPTSIAAPCSQEVCITIYELSVGNTGREHQEDVVVVLSPNALDDAVLPVDVSGNSRRRNVLESDTGIEIHLGEIEPGHRKLVRITLSVPKNHRRHDWSELLMRVTPGKGAANVGSPEVTTFGRLLVGFLNLFI